ncbi:cytochrome P450 [Penicillium longicatenatum]|nr:cytochrome P450 [Penicillium longicatenatum]
MPCTQTTAHIPISRTFQNPIPFKRKFTSVASNIPEESVSESGQSDFSSYLRASHDHKAILSREEILSNHSFLMIAGSETTATFLSGCTFFILKHPEVYKKLALQIRQRFSSPTEMTFSSLAEMSYLRSVLQESLRMYPPVPLGMPRVVPKDGAVVSGQFVPENTSVAVASWATYQSPSNFKDPRLFIPERWLDTDVGGDDIKGAMQAFSKANSFYSLALGEVSLIIARFTWAFDLELSPQCSNWADQRAYIIWDKGPLLVKLTPRS